MLSNSSVITKSICKIAFIALICFFSINAEADDQGTLGSIENEANVNNNYLNNDFEVQLDAPGGLEENDDNPHQDNAYAEENLENTNPVFNNSLFSVLSKGQDALQSMLNKGRDYFSFVTTKLWNFCGILSDIFLPADYFPSTMGDYYAGYIPINIILIYCLYPQAEDLKGLLREVGILSTLHYYFSRFYYR